MKDEILLREQLLAEFTGQQGLHCNEKRGAGCHSTAQCAPSNQPH